jgi:hypothetical protein
MKKRATVHAGLRHRRRTHHHRPHLEDSPMSVCETNRVAGLIDEAPSPKASNGAAGPQRDAHGRFVAGNGGGPGNPFGRYTAQLRVALLAAITEEDMQAVAQKLIEQAKAGSLPAIKLLLQYAIGKPTNAPNPDHVELDEWNYFKKTAEMSDDVGKVLKSLEPETVLDMGREVRPILSELAAKKFARALETGDPSVLYKKASPSADGVCGAQRVQDDRLKPVTANGPPSPIADDGEPPASGDSAGSGEPAGEAPSPIGV